MIDGSKKRNRQLAFELQNSHVCEKRSKVRDLVVIELKLPLSFWPCYWVHLFRNENNRRYDFNTDMKGKPLLFGV